MCTFRKVTWSGPPRSLGREVQALNALYVRSVKIIIHLNSGV